MTSSKLKPCLLKQSLKTQGKLKELELCIKMQSISVFLYIAKFADFQRKNVDVRRTKGVCQMIDIFFGSSLVKVLSFFIVGYV